MRLAREQVLGWADGAEHRFSGLKKNGETDRGSGVSGSGSTIAAVVGGFLLRRLVAGLPERAIFAVLEKYQVFDHHFSAYLFFASTGIDIGHIIVFLFVGCVVAWAARGREMTATMSRALIFSVMAVAAAVAILTRTADAALLWRPTWYFADSFAIVVGGALVRMHRSNRAHLPA